jgi:hypothetical protein
VTNVKFWAEAALGAVAVAAGIATTDCAETCSGASAKKTSNRLLKSLPNPRDGNMGIPQITHVQSQADARTAKRVVLADII